MDEPRYYVVIANRTAVVLVMPGRAALPYTDPSQQVYGKYAHREAAEATRDRLNKQFAQEQPT